MTASYPQTLRHLYGLRRFGLRPGLEVIGAVLKELGHPEQRFPSVHVAGSKGKGSVSAFTASILSAAGLKTGLFTSPHLQSFRERIQVDRVPISPGEVVGGVERIQEASRRLLEGGQVDRAPTFFETATALAFDHFARQRVDAAVVEV
ncbi:MAG TPA: bifunctional folylpolyglutamate synthase/dihydrofolate synthase, partial [Thermoplasmata archaeon]|nr:bifunctional folylpolyglutamate synthase/dihydrofolate synthase [Thermoplasmata archaeon]